MASATAVHFEGHLAAGHVVVLAEDLRRQVCRTHAHGRELEAPAGELFEGDPAWGNLIDGARNLIDRGGEVPVVHPDDRFTGLLDPVHDLLVFDLELGVALGLQGYALPDVVVLARVGRHVGQDGHLVDVGVVLGVNVFQLGMQSRIAGAGQARIAFVDLDERVTDMEVGVVIITGQP